MRTLSLKQKKIIMNRVESTFLNDVDKRELFSILEEINDYETLYQDTQRFIDDYKYSLNGDRYILNYKDWR